MKDVALAVSLLYFAQHFLVDPEWVTYVNTKVALGMIELIEPPTWNLKPFKGDGLAFIRAFKHETFQPLATSTPLTSSPYGSCEELNIWDISAIEENLFDVYD